MGAWLSAVLLCLGTLHVKFEWFTQDSIDAFIVVLGASVPLILVLYGMWKKEYLPGSSESEAAGICTETEGIEVA